MSAFVTLILFCCAVSLCVITSICAPLFRRSQPLATRINAWGMAGVILMGTVALYSYTGAWRGINELATDHASDQSLRVSLPALAAAAEAAPKSLQARESYARALGQAGQHAKAAEEFRAAVLLSGGRPDLILDFATAQILSKDGTITEEANKSVDMVLLMAPREPKARFFKAVYLQQQGDIAQAKQKMTEILADIPVSDALYATIQARLKSMDMPQ